ncbi:MAG: hypothetical protein DYG93_09880 [Leptolyngbya sp. PLA2]|nr:hypothetical protein [Leptolyngbya sp. PL-A2]MCQ3939683.1 hypothetical protein [cyanobacterium CYA1]MDL1903940.1 hypothetical protein [Synechococcales cyanobacterium CNB]GIK18703.1 MAG: hypothetical protein BroJett004_08670 [Planctomycetota bacterium]
MTLDDSAEIVRSWRSSQFQDLVADVLDSCVRYAGYRAAWALADPDKRREMNEARTRCHNALIDRIGVLAREQKKVGEDTAWHTGLPPDRRELGDFACLVHAVLALSTG